MVTPTSYHPTQGQAQGKCSMILLLNKLKSKCLKGGVNKVPFSGRRGSPPTPASLFWLSQLLHFHPLIGCPAQPDPLLAQAPAPEKERPKQVEESKTAAASKL